MQATRSEDWLEVTRGTLPLVVSIPHAGTEIPQSLLSGFASAWLARLDTDWHLERVYEFALRLGATRIATRICRCVVDVNRDPEDRSLYPGMPTTSLCPTTSFDGVPLYRPGHEPDPQAIGARRAQFLEPYHRAVRIELERLRAAHGCVVLFEAHSIRSRVPRLFEGTLPTFNLGTNDGLSCDPALAARLESVLDATGEPRVTNARFKGGYLTRHFGAPARAVHAVQLEMAMRAYLVEPQGELDEHNWPAPPDAARLAALRPVLERVLEACIAFAVENAR